MADIMSTLPVELRRQIFGYADHHTLAQIALVSRILSLDATEILYRDIDSPWPLIRLLNVRVDKPIEDGYEHFVGPTLPLYGQTRESY